MMTKRLDWRNPDDWGKSPLTDNALRVQQMRDETREQTLVEVKTETQKQQKEGKISNPQYPSNEINSVGFPEGQMLANDATPEETALISAAYLQGKALPETGNEVLDRVSDRLTQTSGYGKYSDWGESDD